MSPHIDPKALVRRASIEELCGHRNRALELYARAAELLAEADRAAARCHAGRMSSEMFDALRSGLTFSDKFLNFNKVARRSVDAGLWRHLITYSQLSSLMDQHARDDFEKQLRTDPPEATPENCEATMTQLVADAAMIFRRGVARAFAALDRRFKSHDGFKIGSRVILTHFHSDGFCSSNRSEGALRDVERAFYIIDRKQPPKDWSEGIAAKARAALSWKQRTCEVDTEYFRLKAYANGNAHLWFKRDDLTRQVNKLLAEYYGATLGAPATSGACDPHRPPPEDFGYFPTPPSLAARVAEEARLYARSDAQQRRVLEPSAGDGALLRAIQEEAARYAGPAPEIVAVEVQHRFAPMLSATGATVHTADFFDLAADTLGLFDRIVMNPPFNRDRDADHVLHGLRFLAPGGRLVAIVSAGLEFRETTRAMALRSELTRYDFSFRDLPEGSFAPATNVNTALLTIDKTR